MNKQTKASFKKEILAFFRTRKFLIIACVLVGWSVLNPLLMVGLGSLMNSMSRIYDDMGMDVSVVSSLLGSTASMGVSSAVGELAGTGLVVFILLINSFAGGEQKKRSIIIPKSSGLRNFSYIFPKFIIYPLTALVLAVAGAFASWGISAMIYRINDVSAEGVLVGGILAGVCLMFYTCCHLTLGTATGKSGMSAAVCIVSALLLPNIFAALGSDYIYNPFTLNIMASTVVAEGALQKMQPLDIAMTVLVAIVLMVIFYFIAIFAQNAKQVDNTGNETRL